MTTPRPYVSPDLRRIRAALEEDEERDESHLRPWQRHHPGETESERLDRVYHSCYRCGHFDCDTATLDAHETGCRSADGRGNGPPVGDDEENHADERAW